MSRDAVTSSCDGQTCGTNITQGTVSCQDKRTAEHDLVLLTMNEMCMLDGKRSLLERVGTMGHADPNRQLETP